MSCKGLHCPGCGDGARGLVLGVIALALLAAAAWHVRHGIETGLEIAMWTIAGAAGLGLAGGLVYAGLRIRVRHLAAAKCPQRGELPHSFAAVVRLSAEPVDVPAIEAPRPRTASWPLAGQWAEINPSDERSS